MTTIDVDEDEPAAPRTRTAPAPSRPGAPSRVGVLAQLRAVRAPSMRREHLLTAAYAVAGLAGGLLIASSAPVWRNAAPSWRLTLPGIPHPGTSFVAGALFLLGLTLTSVGWIGLIGRTERMPGDEQRRRRVVLAVLVLWCLPFLFSTPLLSNDSYSYVAQGEMASRGIDPTAQGPYALSRGPFLRAVDPIWRDAPAPYGPVGIQLQEWVVEASGHDPATSVWGMRLLAVAGVALSAVGVTLLARQHGVGESTALAVGVCSPLVLLHLLGGSHNDALMMGLVTVGLAAFGADRKVLGALVVTLAVGVKLPAVVALVFLAWAWAGPGARLWDRVRTSALVVGASSLLLVALCQVVGIGFGWVTALRDTGKVMSTFSFTTKAGFVTSQLAGGLGLDVSSDGTVAVFRLLGLLAAAGITVVLLLRSPQIGTVRAAGLAMVAIVLLGPVVWPWYLPAGVALIAASGLGRFRPSYLVLVVAAAGFVWPTSIDPVTGLQDWQHLLGFCVLLAIGTAAWLAQVISARSQVWRARRAVARAELVLRAG